MVHSTKLYDILGTTPTATIDEIKKAYRKKAIECHPDKFVDPEQKKKAEEKFKELTQAHEVLSDENKRRIYDQCGDVSGGEQGMSFESANDIFKNLFEEFPFSGFNFGGGQRRQRKPQELVVQSDLTLEDVYFGKVKKFQVTRTVKCKTCSGSGCKDKNAKSVCTLCHGSGMCVQLRQIAPHMVQQIQQQCPTCKGSGKIIAKDAQCVNCNGEQLVEEKKKIEIHIEPGTRENEKYVLEGEGNNLADTIEPGDIVILLKEKKHPIFVRNNNDLLYKKTITISDALCGCVFDIPFLDGTTITASTKDLVINPDILYCMQNKGLPKKNNKGFGTLFIKFIVQFPETLSADKVATLKQCFGVTKVICDKNILPANSQTFADHTNNDNEREHQQRQQQFTGQPHFINQQQCQQS